MLVQFSAAGSSWKMVQLEHPWTDLQCLCLEQDGILSWQTQRLGKAEVISLIGSAQPHVLQPALSMCRLPSPFGPTS